MPYDWEDDDQTATHHSRVTVAVGTIRRLIAALVSYALVAGALVAFYGFFAPFIGAEAIAFWEPVVGPIAAPTEDPDTYLNATPAIVGVVCAAAALWLR